jgi:hypothetical protein
VTPRDREIADLIVGPGKETPPWLTAALSKARATLTWIIEAKRAYPNRNELRGRLELLVAAAKFARLQILDLDMVALLRAGDRAMLNEYETYQGLGDLAERATKALAKIPIRRGSDKHLVRSHGATPHQNCALMIIFIWEKCHSKSAANANQNVQAACAALWAQVGGQARRSPKIARKFKIRNAIETTDVWRDHLRAAKKIMKSPEATFLKDSLLDLALPG